LQSIDQNSLKRIDNEPHISDGLDSILFSLLLTTIDGYLRRESDYIEDVSNLNDSDIFSFNQLCTYFQINTKKLGERLQVMTLRQWLSLKRAYNLSFKSTKLQKHVDKQLPEKICPTCHQPFRTLNKFCNRRCVRFTKKKVQPTIPTNNVMPDGSHQSSGTI
jgi:hypothetical protein